MIGVRCPICDKPLTGRSLDEWPEFPFCSPRCKTIDLGRWLKEVYAIGAEEPDGPDDASARDIP